MKPLVAFVATKQVSRQLSLLICKCWIFLNGEMVCLLLPILGFAVKKDSQNKRLPMLVYLDVERAQVFSLSTCCTFAKHLVTDQVHLSSFLVDSIPDFHEIDTIVYQRSRYSCSDCNVSSMQIHVSSLYSFDTQGSKSCKILSKSN